jgi:hypothetical protein
VSTWMSLAWLPICAGLTGGGLLLSWLIWRKAGPGRGSRAVAWSLLPMAAWLTNSILLIGRIGSAIAAFAAAFVFSPKAWAGVILFGVTAVLFLTTGGLPLLRWRKARAGKAKSKEAVGGGAKPAVTGSEPAKRAIATAGLGDDFREVEEILRRRGIG